MESSKHEVIGAIFHPDTRKYTKKRNLIKDPSISATWTKSAAYYFGRFIEGLKRGITVMQTMKMVHQSNIPKDIKVTYDPFVCNCRPQKEDSNRCCTTVDRDIVEYSGDASTKTAYLTTIKCILNSVLTNQRAQFMTAYVKNFYLNTPLGRP